MNSSRLARLSEALELLRAVEREMKSSPTMIVCRLYVGTQMKETALQETVAHKFTEDLAQAILALEEKRDRAFQREEAK